MIKLSLQDREWQPFFIEDIAEIVSGKDIYERERVDGTKPYITATANNNGIGYFVSNTNDTLESGCLSVNRNGSVGYCFYHPYSALYGNDTRKLRPKVNNKYVSLFISMCITSQREKYGYKMGTGRLKRQRILLPVDNYENPDWRFMEEYMRMKESQILKPTIDKLCKQLIENELLGGVNYYTPIGKHSILLRSSLKFNVVSVLKKQTTKWVIRPMFQQHHLIMELMDSLVMIAA